MTLVPRLARLFGRPAPSLPGPAPAAAAAPPPEPVIAAAPPSPPAPARRRRLTPAGWRRVVVDTAVLHWVRWDSRAARYDVLAAAAGLPVDAFMAEVRARHAAVLRRDDRGRRPMEVEDFAARLHVLASADPEAAARLADVRLRGDEAERRAAVANRRRKAAEKTAAARGLAAVLAAGALVGTAVDAPADPDPPPAA